MNRLSIVMRHAAAMGLEVDIQATDKARALLGKSRHVVAHVPSLHWKEVPEFYESLTDGTLTHLALRLLILSGLRSKPIRFCNLDQIEGDVWTVPAENMKARKGKAVDFCVPLSGEMLSIIEQAKPFSREGHLFPSVRKGVMSDAIMSRLMERRGLEVRPHGFRASLRTWAAETTDAPWEVVEMLIAHSFGTKVEKTYLNADFLEQRRILMERWADHVTGQMGAVIRLAK